MSVLTSSEARRANERGELAYSFVMRLSDDPRLQNSFQKIAEQAAAEAFPAGYWIEKTKSYYDADSSSTIMTFYFRGRPSGGDRA